MPEESLLRNTGGLPVEHIPFLPLARHYLGKVRQAAAIRDWHYIVHRRLSRRVAQLRREVLHLAGRWPRLPSASAAVVPRGENYSQLRAWNGNVRRATDSLSRLLLAYFLPEVARAVQQFLLE